MTRYQHIYLSPHIDDVSLSCGGTIYHQQQAGEAVLSVTVFAAQPTAQKFSSYVDWMHGIWGNLDEVVATRLAEDKASMAVLGCDAQYLPFLDCIYRGEPEADVWYYTSNEELFGELHPDDLPLSEAVAGAVIKLNPDPVATVIYAPLAIGHHVDHQLVHQAARRLHAEGYHVVFYEDYPYADPAYPYSSHSAENAYPLEAALADSADLQLAPRLQALTEADLQAKVASIRAYSSQIAMLFENETLVEKAVRGYTLRVGQGKPAERVWMSSG